MLLADEPAAQLTELEPPEVDTSYKRKKRRGPKPMLDDDTRARIAARALELELLTGWKSEEVHAQIKAELLAEGIPENRIPRPRTLYWWMQFARTGKLRES